MEKIKDVIEEKLIVMIADEEKEKQEVRRQIISDLLNTYPDDFEVFHRETLLRIEILKTQFANSGRKTEAHLVIFIASI